MLTKLSITTINLYQHYLSPHKGYCCAYRAYTGEDSCSQFAKVAIAEHGLFSAFPYIKEQFEKCALAAQEMKKEREKKKKSDAEVLGDCACDIGCRSLDCSSTPLPRGCSKKSQSSSADHCDIGGCDTIGDCHPFH